MKFLIAITFLFLSNSYAAIFPASKWTLTDTLSPEKKDALTHLLFDKDKPYFTKSFLIVKDGKIIFEKDNQGFSSLQAQKMWSVSKTVSSILIGIAQKQGLINQDDQINKYYQSLGKGLTITHLLQMSSGLDWKETYETNPLDSDVLKMLYISNYKNMASFVATKEQKYKPGTHFNYSSGETNLLMSILQKKVSRKDYEDFPWKHLFNKLQISSATWERDHSGNFIGSSYLYLSPRDLARIGLLYLQNGKWKDEEIVSKDWVNFSKSLAPSVLTTELKGKKKWDSYGAHWWLNSKLPNAGKKHKNAPEDIFMALGHHGQAMMVVPSENMIIVRTADDREDKFDRNKIFKILFKDKYVGK